MDWRHWAEAGILTVRSEQNDVNAFAEQSRISELNHTCMLALRVYVDRV